jgi:hypothetical protein
MHKLSLHTLSVLWSSECDLIASLIRARPVYDQVRSHPPRVPPPPPGPPPHAVHGTCAKFGRGPLPVVRPTQAKSWKAAQDQRNYRRVVTCLQHLAQPRPTSSVAPVFPSKAPHAQQLIQNIRLEQDRIDHKKQQIARLQIEVAEGERAAAFANAAHVANARAEAGHAAAEWRDDWSDGEWNGWGTSSSSSHEVVRTYIIRKSCRPMIDTNTGGSAWLCVRLWVICF